MDQNREGFAPVIILLTILGIVLIIALIQIFIYLPWKNSPHGWYPSGGSYLVPTSTVDDAFADTSTWKTYTDQQYGFSLRYPSSWQFEAVDTYAANGKVLVPKSEFYFTNLQNLERLDVAPLGNQGFPLKEIVISQKTNANGAVLNWIEAGNGNTIFDYLRTYPVPIPVVKEYPNFQISYFPINAREYLTPDAPVKFNAVLSTFQFFSPYK